jgi:S1-C subfamily serine protease
MSGEKKMQIFFFGHLDGCELKSLIYCHLFIKRNSEKPSMSLERKKMNYKKYIFVTVGLIIVFGVVVPNSSFAIQDVRNSIVKIYAVSIRPDHDNPWNMKSPQSKSGSGCIIEGNRILTNAHVVADSSFIQVRLHGHYKKYTAHVIAIAHEVDLALLTIDDSSFFDITNPIDLGTLPQMQQDVVVYGFPEGGDTLSTTVGVISRIEHQSYSHSGYNFIAIQIDAAINAGNSGGPALVNGKICGVAMQTLDDSENLGYLVPVPLIEHFLIDIQDGSYDGFPYDGIFFQKMENEGLKRMYGLKKNQSGVLVTSIVLGSPSDGKIKSGDVLLSIDGHEVADDGTSEFRLKERTGSDYFVQQHQIGETAVYGILRDKKQMTVDIKLNKKYGDSAMELVPGRRYDILPDYYIYGGIVFIPLTLDYLLAWGDDWRKEAPSDQVYYYDQGMTSVKGEEVVVISKTLLSEVNKGYASFIDDRIVKVDEKRISNLNHLISIVENKTGKLFVVFETATGDRLVLDREAVALEQQKILKTYHVPRERSESFR